MGSHAKSVLKLQHIVGNLSFIFAANDQQKKKVYVFYLRKFMRLTYIMI